MRTRSSPLSDLSRRWRAACARRPWLPALLVLLALNSGYRVWSQAALASDAERAPAELNPASIVLLTPEEGQRRQALAQTAARAKAAPAPDMLVEYEAVPAKEIPPER
ncbi:MAG: hypothetical protein QE283_13265 [Rhodoferax sp.]|nr:hypothetical protein [Rhodoferax sp.]